MIESFNGPAESKDLVDSGKNSEKKNSKPSADKKKLGTFTAKNVLEAPNIHRPKVEKSSIWEELVERATKKRDEEPLPKPEKNVSEPSDEKEGMAHDAEVKDASESQLENLEQTEKQEVVRRVAEARANEIRKQSPETDQTETAAVEDAASIALLESVRQKLEDNPDAPVEEVLDAAEAETVERMEADDEAESPESEESVPAEDLREGEIPLHAETTGDEEGTGIIPLSPPRAGSGSGGATPPPTGTGGGGSGSGGGGGGGGTPPRTPGGAGIPPRGSGGAVGGVGAPFGPLPSGPNIYAGSPPGPGVSVEDLNRIVHRQERIAIAQGLLVGGIVGYLIGRRRGRIKAEKRLIPIQKKLEKQVETLQSTVLEREQKVRAMAAEKARDMTNQEARDRFARRLAHYEAISVQGASHRKERAKEAPRPLQLGRMVVEAPAVVLGVGTAGGREAEAGIETPRPAALPNKKVEKYTAPELKQAAEKIRIDGTSLKELWDRGELDQKAVERVITAYIEGKSVRATLNKELFEEEARFEIDPKLRDDKKTSSPGGGSDKSVVAQAGAAMLLSRLNGGNKNDTHKPQPDQDKKNPDTPKQPSIFEQARHEPVMQLAAGGVVVAIVLIAAILIFG